MEANRLVKRVWMDAMEGKCGEWSNMRKNGYERVGWSELLVQQRLAEEGCAMYEIRERLREVELQERQGELERGTYNPRYVLLQVHGSLPQYIRNANMNMDDKITLARARCGAEERGRKVWMGAEYGECVLCRNGEDTWWHLAEQCEGVRQDWLGARNQTRNG